MRFIIKVLLLFAIGLGLAFFVVSKVQGNQNQPKQEQVVQKPDENSQAVQQSQPQQKPTTDLKQKASQLEEKGKSLFNQGKAGLSALIAKLMPLLMVVGGVVLGYFIINDL